MLNINSIEDISALKESIEVECKLANGKDGTGALPKSFWETYSSFANTHGGHVFLGLEEKKDGEFNLVGIKNTGKVLDELWTSLRNPQKVNIDILDTDSVRTIKIEGKDIIHIHIPRARRQQKPVYISNNPMLGSYIRRNSVDSKLDAESVKRMLAEQLEDGRDNEILINYGVADLNADSIKSYRNMYVSLMPGHPYSQKDGQEFLEAIGAFRRDRKTGKFGLTRAGLLMFGNLQAIQEAFHYYMLDYREISDVEVKQCWIDRITLDGTWSGNLFDFYHRVIRKLTVSLKVPFRLERDQRKDDSVVHQALREAMINMLVHADYTGRASVRVLKRPDMIQLRNPGDMRIPEEIAVKGGESDCRNRLLHRMFRFIGLGEEVGSGVPKIYQGWRESHWRKPFIKEEDEPFKQTLVELYMTSLLPPQMVEELKCDLGRSFDTLSRNEILILVTIKVEKTVNHARMMNIIPSIHPSDLSKLFSSLIERNLICRSGLGKGTVYFFSETALEDMATEYLKQKELEENSRVSSVGMNNNENRWKELQSIAKSISSTKRTAPEKVIEVILELCSIKPLTLDNLSKLLNRSSQFIRKEYLQKLVKARKLKLLYPTAPNHPQQAYLT